MAGTDKFLNEIYDVLLAFFGPRGWWPGESRWEIMVGAVLTQVVAWKNVEKAIANLKKEGLLELESLYEAEEEKIADLIKPALYHRQKAKKLKVLSGYVMDNYHGDLDLMFKKDLYVLRRELLDLWGIGPETADSILLYAGDKPVFVVDAYTIRIFSRLGMVHEKISYKEMQDLIQRNLASDVQMFNEYHALLVALGANYCLKSNPKCKICPLNNFCNYFKISRKNK
ncbi:endonuclease III domain-containing protein [Thermosyntropha sp.]|uniref:endonuclease III domain-containing protein n=1 Tax=Thermosyntropha sp. TaxID=2740820 RepID=UPI0025FB5F79|nr:endonuclease III domain-containing protein [Thermosyntropha sp.]MBO8159307.1 endonuclease III domain-containing protein [Thermosyntropha sp.]